MSSRKALIGDLIYKIIGRSEKVSFPDFGFVRVPAKIDTGAKTSALWASRVHESEAGLEFSLFGPSSKLYTGERHVVREFEKIVVASSIGEHQERYKIRAQIKVRGKKINSFFTLADRSKQAYPVLLGRNVLRGKFVVDVKSGRPDIKAEKKRSSKLQAKLKKGTI